MVSEREVIELMGGIANDSTVPKNIRKALSNASQKMRSDEELTVRVSSAIYEVEAISEDVNMPTHARMQIWSILSALESLKK